MNKADLKTAFSNGKIPSGDDFANLIDYILDLEQAKTLFVQPSALSNYLQCNGNSAIFQKAVFGNEINTNGTFKLKIPPDYKLPLVQCYKLQPSGELKLTDNYTLVFQNSTLIFDFTPLSLQIGDELQIVVR